MDKDKRDDLNENGIDDEIEPHSVDAMAGSRLAVQASYSRA